MATGRRDPEPPARSPAAGRTAAPAEAREPDEVWVREVLAGKRERYEALIERHQGAVFSVLLAQVRDHHLAEDLAQEVFVSAFGALRQLRSGERFLPWLLQIARHRASREMHRKSRRPEVSTGVLLEVAQRVPDETASRAAEVLALVAQLPDQARQTILLKYQLGLSCKEIAEREGVPVGTVTSRLTRALMVLRSALGGEKKRATSGPP